MSRCCVRDYYANLLARLDASRHAASLPGLEKTGHGMLDVTKAIVRSADTFSIRSLI
ncbi:hypothetical protein KCP70_00565 [Salmonella enterica subsp. enterica]|nr:hypothetical protein KCP70_00565 [Salmonella enterica subsp. enterica]